MVEQSDFQQQAERVNALVQKVNELHDSVARATALELLQEIMSLHASVLDRMLDITSKTGESGIALIENFARDPLVCGLLVLYDLHPENLETRIGHAIEKVRPSLRSHGADVELTEVAEGRVRLRLTGNWNGCAGSTATLRKTVEQAIYEAAPEIAEIIAEESGHAVAGFVPIAQLQGAA